VLLLIVISGATVRLTASGLGCENWPRCGDTFLPPKDYHALIEFGNRGVGVVVGLVTLAAAIVGLRVQGLPRWLRATLWSLPVTVLLQGILGGITVLVELHPLTVMGHFLLSLVAVGIAVVAVLGVREFATTTTPHPPLAANWLALVLVPATLTLVVTGTLVTAAGPHSGGEDIRRIGVLPDALHLHIGATALFGIVYLGLVAALFRAQPRAGTELQLAAAILGVLLIQMVIGEIQWRTELPWGLVLVHVALATTVWASVVALATRLLLRSRPRLP
jgi:cytochrome c oxidase assembly protein subunit 15